MPLSWPSVQTGSNGEDVRTVQYLLTAQGHPLTVDGIFGSLTTSAVEAFQSTRGLAADGVVGTLTWPALILRVGPGSSGDAVRAVQSQVHVRGDGAVIAVDGVFGPMTSDAVSGFQLLAGAPAGAVGPETWGYLVAGYFSATDPRSAAQRSYDAWTQDDRDRALLDATPAAVTQLFSQAYSSTAGWTFEGSGVAAGTVYYTWRRSAGGELQIAVEDATEGVFYGVVGATFS
jgi:peptidoglycan hydrolase-like protein with peptidoglycan-binding domain